MKKFLLAALLWIIAVPAFSAEWYRSAVFYEIFLRSFYDSNGDGVGDFNGLTAKLNYLNDGDPATTSDLGINAIWLMPVFQSPSYHGYDTDDYYKIDDEYGTLADFDRFLAEAHKRGIRVILDLVINHTSTRNEWFVKSCQKIAPYTDYYVWSKQIPAGDWQVPWGGGHPSSVWHYNATRGEYFYAAFWEGMPDLNMKNPQLTQEIYKIAKYWLDRGVDGFRLDGARYLIEDGPGTSGQSDTPSTIKWWSDFKTYVRSVKPDAVLVGEVWTAASTVARYYNDGKGIDICFDFEFGDKAMNAGKYGSFGSLRQLIEKRMQLDVPANFFAPFLANHDTTRAMTVMNTNFNAAKIAALLLFTTPGVPFMYYGEEIGMYQLPGQNRDNFKRAPMQWDSTSGGGFTTGAPWQALTTTAQAYTVKQQERSGDSLLNMYKKLLQIRSQNPELQTGDYVAFDTSFDKLFAFERSLGGTNKTFVVLNGSLNEKVLTNSVLAASRYVDLLTGRTIRCDNGMIKIPAKTYYILKEKTN